MNITGPWHCDNWWCNDASVGNLNSQRMVNSLHLVWWLNLQPLPAINQNIMFKWILIWIRSSRYALFGILLRTRWFHSRFPSASPSLSLFPFHVIIFIIIIIGMLNKVFKQIFEESDANVVIAISKEFNNCSFLLRNAVLPISNAMPLSVF